MFVLSPCRHNRLCRISLDSQAASPLYSPPHKSKFLSIMIDLSEKGVGNLKGKSTHDRALAVIGRAHPKFRDELLKEAERMYLL